MMHVQINLYFLLHVDVELSNLIEWPDQVTLKSTLPMVDNGYAVVTAGVFEEIRISMGNRCWPVQSATWGRPPHAILTQQKQP